MANKGNIKTINQLLGILKSPYTEKKDTIEYQLPMITEKKYQTFCGT